VTSVTVTYRLLQTELPAVRIVGMTIQAPGKRDGLREIGVRMAALAFSAGVLTAKGKTGFRVIKSGQHIHRDPTGFG
jgi:hypothetical protein